MPALAKPNRTTHPALHTELKPGDRVKVHGYNSVNGIGKLVAIVDKRATVRIKGTLHNVNVQRVSYHPGEGRIRQRAARVKKYNLKIMAGAANSTETAHATRIQAR